MAWPGKAIFDVTMMAGWAFAAILTGLVALTMVDDTGTTGNDSGVIASLETGDARLVTGSIKNSGEITTDANGASGVENALLDQQNKTFNPFEKQSEAYASQFQELMAEVKSLRREVEAFHVTAGRLRDENDLLKQRLAKLELGKENNNSNVRIVDLPKRDDARNPFFTDNAQSNQIDMLATGSIDKTTVDAKPEASFDPFSSNSNPQIRTNEQPLTMDFGVKKPLSGNSVTETVMLPRGKPTLNGLKSAAVLLDSGLIKQDFSAESSSAASKTAFGLDLGEFLSLSDIRGAWKDVSSSQQPLVQGLKPLSRIAERADNRLALHLVLGPIQNAASAAELCAQLNFRSYSCSVTSYRGQSLDLR